MGVDEKTRSVWFIFGLLGNLNQPSNQVVEQAERKYGLTVRGFTGPIKEYEPSAKVDYRNGDRLVVTTYSIRTHRVAISGTGPQQRIQVPR
jgi:hypothetical protein